MAARDTTFLICDFPAQNSHFPVKIVPLKCNGPFRLPAQIQSQHSLSWSGLLCLVAVRVSYLLSSCPLSTSELTGSAAGPKLEHLSRWIAEVNFGDGTSPKVHLRVDV